MSPRVRVGAAGPCSIGDAVDALGGGWKGEVIWYLSGGPKRFMELRRLIPAISPKVLTQALRSLERDGLVSRVQHPEIPPRVEYSLTALGRSAGPVLQAIADWWKKNGEAVRSSAAARARPR
jgi:DNA-binding HxlR family transcriptional regulator